MVYRPLLDRRTGTHKDHDRTVHTICRECFVHCGLTAYLNQNAIVDIQGDRTHPANRGRLCARGIAFIQGLHSPDRLQGPLVRANISQPFEPADNWDKALDLCAERLRRIKDQYGPRSIVIGCSQDAGLDFTIGAMRFGRLLGTPHVVQPYRGLNAPHPPVPQPCPAHPGYDWPHKTSILLVEADLATTHPVVFGRVMQAKQAGAKIAVADARFTRTMSKADLALRILPGSGNLLGVALLKRMLQDAVHLDAIGRLGTPFEWKAAFGRLPWVDILAAVGLGSAEIDALSMHFHDGRPALIITGQTLGADSNYDIWHALLRAMGSGVDWYPLEPAVPRLFPERDLPQTITDGAIDRATFHNDRRQHSLGVETDGDPPFKAIISGGDCFSHVFAPLIPRSESADFIVALGSFFPTTRRFAHLLLPAALWAEKNELCFNSDRMVQWASKIRDPGAHQKSGLDFWSGLAQRFGWRDAFPWIDDDGNADSDAFYQWILDSSPATRTRTLKNLKNRTSPPLIWSLEADPPGTVPPPGAVVPETLVSLLQDPARGHYPLYFQKAPAVSHSAVPGQSWPWTRELENPNDVQIHPQTANALGIENGETLVIRSSKMTMEGRAWISRMVPAWMVASPGALGSGWVLVHKPNQSEEESRTLLKGCLS